MSKGKKQSEKAHEPPTKIKGTFLDVFKVVKANKEQKAKAKKKKP
jgi:hypothetical protein